uniref:Uncharacterized protein n=1 Tax=Zea mays TaxID=4577 RepID=C4J301_MAIZE|nr:unknown [Zea mays]
MLFSQLLRRVLRFLSKNKRLQLARLFRRRQRPYCLTRWDYVNNNASCIIL